MVTRFEDVHSRWTRALQIWLVLLGKAHLRQTMTYTELRDVVKFGSPVGLGHVLEPILCYCLQHDLPPLSVLVVNRETGVPGMGFDASGDWHKAREEVYRFDWYGMVPPSPEDFEQATLIWERRQADGERARTH